MRARERALVPCLLLLITLIAACSAEETVPRPTALPTEQATKSPTPVPLDTTFTSVPTERPTPSVESLPSPVEGTAFETSSTEAPSSTAPPGGATRIECEPGDTSQIISGHIAAGATEHYVIQASADQVMHVRADAPKDVILLEVAGPDGRQIEGQAAGKPFWRGRLPATQDYLITLTTAGEAVDYQLSITIYARITFAPDGTSTTLSGHLGDHQTDHYVLQAQEGQTMDVVAEAPQEAGLTIWGADGIPLKRYVDEERTWRGELPKTQDYFIEVRSIETTSYTLTVSTPAVSLETEGVEQAWIEVVAPNGGEEWLEGSTYTLVWTSSGVGKVDVAVASGGKPLEQIVLGADASGGQISWGIPVGLISNFGVAESNAMRVRVSSSDDPSHYDENDDAFTVQCPRIRFEPGSTSESVSGTLETAGDQLRYALRASAGQTMELGISPARIKIEVWGTQDGSTWDIGLGQSDLTIPSLPASQDYLITLTKSPDAEAINYTLEVLIR